MSNEATARESVAPVSGEPSGSIAFAAGVEQLESAIEDRHLSSWRTLLRSFAHLSIGEFLARLLGFAALIAMTRRLGPASFGVVTLGIALVGWLKIVVDSGTETLNIREISRRPDRFKEIAGAVLGLRLCLAGLVILLAVPLLLLVSHESDRRTLSLFTLALPAIALNVRFMVLGLDKAKAVAVGNVVAQLVFATGVLVLVRGPSEEFVVPILLAAGELAYGAIVVVFVFRRFGLPLPRIDVRAWRSTLRGGLPLMVSQLVSGAVYSVSLLLITAVLGSYWTGVYGAAYRPLLFFATLMALLTGSFLASYSAASSTQARQLFHRTTGLALVVSLVLALALSIGSGVFLSVAFGSDYASGATALAILAWFIPVSVLGSTYGMVLIARNRQAVLMRHNIAAALFNIGAIVAAVPLAGISGAAMAALVSSALLMFLNHRSCTRLGLAPSVGEMLATAIARGASRPSIP